MTVTRDIATIVDIVNVAGGRHGYEGWLVIREQWMHGLSWAMRVGDQLIAICGFYPYADDEAEAWYMFTPQARPHLKGLAREAGLTLRSAPYRRIICLCTSPEGARFARLAGFAREGPFERGELWSWRNSSRASSPGSAASSAAATSAETPIAPPASPSSGAA